MPTCFLGPCRRDLEGLLNRYRREYEAKGIAPRRAADLAWKKAHRRRRRGR
jgi:hypothetical protein